MKTLKVFVATTLLTAMGAAMAGYINHYEVNVSGNTAWGSFSGARKSADAVQYIGCASVNFSGSTPYAVCYARTAANVYKSCTTTEAAHLETVRGLSNESYIYMRWTDAGVCDYIYGATGSMYHM